MDSFNEKWQSTDNNRLNGEWFYVSKKLNFSQETDEEKEFL